MCSPHDYPTDEELGILDEMDRALAELEAAAADLEADLNALDEDSDGSQ